MATLHPADLHTDAVVEQNPVPITIESNFCIPSLFRLVTNKIVR